MLIIAFIALQRSAIISIADASIGIILQTMPSLVISTVILHIIGMAIIGIIMPPIIGMPGMPPIGIIPPPIIGICCMPPIGIIPPPIIGIDCMPPIGIIPLMGIIIGIIMGMAPGFAGVMPPAIIGIALIGVIGRSRPRSSLCSPAPAGVRARYVPPGSGSTRRTVTPAFPSARLDIALPWLASALRVSSFVRGGRRLRSG